MSLIEKLKYMERLLGHCDALAVMKSDKLWSLNDSARIRWIVVRRETSNYFPDMFMSPLYTSRINQTEYLGYK